MNGAENEGAEHVRGVSPRNKSTDKQAHRPRRGGRGDRECCRSESITILIVLLIGSLLNILVIWSARRPAVVVLWLGYNAALASAFIRPALFTRGVAYSGGYLVPGPSLAALLAMLAVEAALLAATRLDGHRRDEFTGVMKTAIACFSSFVIECILAMALMVMLGVGMYGGFFFCDEH